MWYFFCLAHQEPEASSIHHRSREPWVDYLGKEKNPFVLYVLSAAGIAIYKATMTYRKNYGAEKQFVACGKTDYHGWNFHYRAS